MSDKIALFAVLVHICRRHRGTVAFVGEVHYVKGMYVGVVMDDRTVGKNDGVVKGVEYFRCKSGEKGLMVPINEVRPL